MEIQVFISTEQNVREYLLHSQETLQTIKSLVSEHLHLPCSFFNFRSQLNSVPILINETFPLSFYFEAGPAYISVSIINESRAKGYSELMNSISKHDSDHFLEVYTKENFSEFPVLPNFWTFAHLAASTGAADILDEVLKLSPNIINKETSDKWTPLMLSAAHGQLECCKKLIKHTDLQIDYCNYRGTALHCAVINGHKSCVEFLLFSNASVIAEDFKGKRPIELTTDQEILELIAKFQGFLEIAKYTQEEKPLFAGEVFLYGSGFFVDTSVFLYVNLDKGLLEEYINKSCLLNKEIPKVYFSLRFIEEVRPRFRNSWNIKGNYYFMINAEFQQIYYCKSEEVRDEWVDKIKSAIEYCKVNKIGPKPQKTMKKDVFTVIDQPASVPTLEMWQKNLCLEDFERLSELGSGSFASVYKVVEKSSGIILAMKCLSKKFLEKKKMLSYAQSEIEIMKELDHPFILKLYYSITNEFCIYLILEYCEQGDLESIMEKKGISEVQSKFYLAEILLALEYLHSKGVIYRDLKPANVLIDSQGHVRLADFGLAKAIGETEQSVSTMVGSPAYISPEILARENISKAADLYAFGIVMHQLLTGELPFAQIDMDKIFMLIRNSRFTFSNKLKKEAKELIRLLLNRKAERRPKFRDIKKHNYFADVNWELLKAKRYLPPGIEDEGI